MKIRMRTYQKLSKSLKKEKEGNGRFAFGAKEGNNESFCNKLKSVITNGVFVSLCLCLAGLYFVVTGI